jgi:hypothetical protein
LILHTLALSPATPARRRRANEIKNLARDCVDRGDAPRDAFNTGIR